MQFCHTTKCHRCLKPAIPINWSSISRLQRVWRHVVERLWTECPMCPMWTEYLNALDRRVLQRVPVPANIQRLCTAIVEEWDNITQTTINSLYAKEMCRTVWGKWWSHQILTGPYLFLRYPWPTDAYLYSQKYILRLGPNEFISFVWFPFMNCNSIKSLKLLHVAFTCLFSKLLCVLPI